MAGGLPTGSNPAYMTPHPFSIIGAGFSVLQDRNEANVRAELEDQVKSDPGITGLSDQVFSGINPALGIVAGVIEAMLRKIIGSIPIIGPVAEEWTGELLDQLGTYYTHLSDFFGSINFMDEDFDPANAVEQFVNLMMLPLNILLGPNSPLDANNIFNIIPQRLLGFLPMSNIGSQQPNLLANPKFEGAVSVQGNGIWLWDGTTGHDTPGSAKIVADGTAGELVSNAIAVSPGQTVNLSVWAKWSGLTFTGVPFRIQILEMEDYTPGASVNVSTPISPGMNQASFVQISGNYTVPETGVDMICFQLATTNTATAGTIWFDDADLHKTGQLQIPWIEGLQGNLDGLLQNFQNIIEAGWQSVFGDFELGIMHTVDQLRDALMNIPATNVGGAGGLPNILETFQETWSQLWGGFALDIGTSKSIADAANAASVVAQNSGTALELGSWNNAILETRNNKGLFSGMDETSESNYLMDKLMTGGSTPPVEVPSLSGVSCPISFWRATEGALKGFVSWYGRGITSVTSLVIDIYKLNYVSGQMELVLTSPNLIGQFASDSTYQLGIWYLDSGTQIQVTPGEVYGICWRSTGGTHYIAGISAGSWFPLDTTMAAPKKPSATRTSGTSSIAFGSLTYSNNIAWFGFGIVAGDIPPDYHAPRTKTLTTPGNNQVFTVESWMNIIDIVLYPGGAGGHGGNGGTGQGGDGGNAGTPVKERLVRGVDFPAGFNGNILFDIGAGGQGGDREEIGDAGGLTRRQAIASGKAAFSTAGGTPGGGYAANSIENSGKSPGNMTNDSGITVIGGIGASGGSGDGGDGSAPGGGGQGGQGGFWTVAWPGGNGAPGMAHIYSKQS